MISRLKDDSKGISVIRDPNAEDEEDVAYCPDCSEYRNKLHRLGPLIILNNDPLPADYDNWKQCGYCYKKVAIYDVRHEGGLHTDIEGVRNAFDFGSAQMKGVHKKGLHNRMKDIAAKNKSKEQSDYSKDKEVMQEVRDGAVITGYYTTSTDVQQ
jgi:hypothetical protein